MQQATSVQNLIFHNSDKMQVQAAQQLPQQYTSIPQASRQKYGEIVSYLTSNFTSIVQQYQNHSNMTIENSGCGDLCSTTVKVC